jgi:hypothetical protein
VHGGWGQGHRKNRNDNGMTRRMWSSFFFLIFWRGGDSIEAANEPRQKCASFIFLRRVHLKNPELFHDGKGYIIPAK